MERFKKKTEKLSVIDIIEDKMKIYNNSPIDILIKTLNNNSKYKNKLLNNDIRNFKIILIFAY